MTNQITVDTTKEELLSEYKSYPATGGENLLEDKPFAEARILPLFYEVPVGSRVLDIGANDGTFIEMLQKKRGCMVFGVDISEVAIEEARKRGVTVQYADAHKLPYGDKAFDVVVLSEVISHVQNPDEVLAEIRRVLKKDGFLLGSAPHANLQRFAWEDARKIRQYYDVDGLSQVLAKQFDRAWIKTLTGAQFAVSMMKSFLANEPAEMLFKCGGLNTQNWDQALNDRSILRVWMGGTQGPGDFYYRMGGFADKMQKLGAETHYNPYDENNNDSVADWCQKIRYLPSEKRFTNSHMVFQLEQLLKASDLSVFQVTSSRDIVLLLTTAKLGVIKKPMYTEMDDWIFDIPSANLASGPYHPNSEPEAVAYDQLKLSDGFIVSTEYLKEKLTELCPGKPIYVVKNALDFDIWDNLKKNWPLHLANPDLIRVGYSGCGNHSGDLEVIVEPIKALLDEFKNLEFVSLNYPSTDKIGHERHKIVKAWVPISQFPQHLATWELDIGIAPLKDNEFNRAKSNLRWLEYSALCIPTVASNVYPFENSIENGKTGVIVSNSQKQWYDSMRDLIVNQEKRIKIGDAAYKKVRKCYSMDEVAKTYMSILKEIKRGFVKGKRLNEA